MKCDNCNRAATVHLTEIKGGKKIEKHLCEQCAAASEGLAVKTHTPINELLTNFVMAHSGLQKEMGLTCDQCGISWAEFRQSGLLGCANDYDVFEKELTPLMQRAHEGATHHVGKTPARRGPGPASPKAASPAATPVQRRRTVDLSRLRRELAKAVEAEDYERAAKLRDQIRAAEGVA